jgi:hypothetical protein
MTLSVKAAALSGFVQTLHALDAILDKAVAQAETRKIQPEVLLSARLAPDMLAFTRQIQLCCDFAKNAVARLSGGENPRFPDEEKSFPELKERIAKTLAFIAAADGATLDAGLAREVTFPRGRDDDRRGLSHPLRHPEFLFPRHHGLRHPAPERLPDRQAGLPARRLRRLSSI